MADYPIYTPPKDLYLLGVPFPQTSGGGDINGCWFYNCHLRIDSTDNMQISGALFFEAVTNRQGYPKDSWFAGTSFGSSQDFTNLEADYTLRIHCYDSNSNFLGTVVPNECNNHIIYDVPNRSSLPSGKMYNWFPGSRGTANARSTCEPWVIRYPSDKAGNLYNPLNKYYDEDAKFKYTNAVGQSPIVTRSYLKDNGWQSFGVNLIAGTSKVGVELYIHAGYYNVSGSVTLYSADIDPVIIDTTSRIWKKPAGSTGWTKNVGIWYRKAGSENWEKKYIYKRPAGSSSWTRL